MFTAIAVAVGIVSLPLAGYAGQARAAGGAARFEVTSLREVRPTIQKLIADLQKKDQAAAKADIEAFDAAWIGREVYVNTRNMDMYNDIEHNWEAKLTKELGEPNADLAAALSDAQSLLKSYDAMLDYVAKAAPLNSKFDDVARLRIERSHLRDVQNFLKEGNVAAAKKSWTAFDDNWDNIEDLVKDRSRDAYDSIEKNMVTLEKQLMPAKPDTEMVNATITAINTEYNKIVQQITKEARDANTAK
jgi:soluble cytochrome b562